MSTVAMLPLYNAIHAKLSGNAPLSTALGGRIRLIEAAQDEALPLLVFTPTQGVPERFFAGGSGDDSEDVILSFNIDMYGNAEASKPEALVGIHDLVIALLDCKNLAATGYDNAHTKADSYGNLSKEDAGYRITSQWRLTATPA